LSFIRFVLLWNFAEFWPLWSLTFLIAIFSWSIVNIILRHQVFSIILHPLVTLMTDWVLTRRFLQPSSNKYLYRTSTLPHLIIRLPRLIIGPSHMTWHTLSFIRHRHSNLVIFIPMALIRGIFAIWQFSTDCLIIFHLKCSLWLLLYISMVHRLHISCLLCLHLSLKWRDHTCSCFASLLTIIHVLIHIIHIIDLLLFLIHQIPLPKLGQQVSMPRFTAHSFFGHVHIHQRLLVCFHLINHLLLTHWRSFCAQLVLVLCCRWFSYLNIV